MTHDLDSALVSLDLTLDEENARLGMPGFDLVPRELVAAKMRVSKMTVYRLVHGGELPAVRVGRSFRVTEDDVNEYLRKSFYNAG